MKTTLFFGLCYLLAAPYTVQSQIQKEPASYSKIKIVYERHPNIDYNERGVFADTMLLKSILPATKFIKIKSPTDHKEIIGFMAIKDLSKEEKFFVSRFIFYHIQLITISYDREKDKAVIYHTSGYDRTETSRLNNIFETNFHHIRLLPYTYRYKENSKYTKTVAGYKSKGNIQDNQVKWLEDRPNMGTFEENNKGMKYTNLLYTNTALNKYISPVLRFGNCELGIEKIVSYNYTEDLLSVTYQ